MKTWIALSAVFITLGMSTAAAAGQKIYRCGSEYSQVPCSDAVVVDADDPRSSAQKLQSDATIKRDAAAAKALEKARLDQEAALRAAAANDVKAQKAPGKHHSTKAAKATPSETSDDTVIEKKGQAKSKKKEPTYFTARSTLTPKKEKDAPKN